MKKITEYTQAELNELFRRACEGAMAEGQGSSVAMVVESLVENRTLVKRALRARVSVSDLRKHLEVIGVQCSTDCLRLALVRGGFRRAKPAKPGATAPGQSREDDPPE